MQGNASVTYLRGVRESSNSERTASDFLSPLSPRVSIRGLQSAPNLVPLSPRLAMLRAPALVLALSATLVDAGSKPLRKYALVAEALGDLEREDFGDLERDDVKCCVCEGLTEVWEGGGRSTSATGSSRYLEAGAARAKKRRRRRRRTRRRMATSSFQKVGSPLPGGCGGLERALALLGDLT